MEFKELQEKDKNKLVALGVGILYLFGSQAEGTAGKGSDVDVGIVFTDPATVRGNTLDIYNALYDMLSETLDLSGNKTTDIVFLERAGLELAFDVITHGRILFEVSTDARLEYEDRVASLYRDFYPILLEADKAVLSRV